MELEQKNESKLGWDVGLIIEKKWGTDIDVFHRDNLSIHQIIINKGEGCSEHKHFHKYNRFIVISGILEITIWTRKEQGIRTFIIGPSKDYAKFDVFPGVWHRFKALEDTIAIEIYWTKCDKLDILRREPLNE